MLEDTYCHSRGISQWGCLDRAVGGGRPGAGIQVQLSGFFATRRLKENTPGKEPTAVAWGLPHLLLPHNQDKP